MPLPSLAPVPNTSSDVQRTTLSLDVLGRFICSTWEEATSVPEAIDAVVIGSGLFGGYCASKIYELSRQQFGTPLRVLVLEAGPFLVPEHTQNIPNLNLYDPGIFNPTSASSGEETGTRNLVWGIGWRSNAPFVGQAYCVGGKGLFWGGWCPRLVNADLVQWPAEVRDWLTQIDTSNPVGVRPIEHLDLASKKPLARGEPLTGYEAVEYEIGVAPTDDFVFDPVQIVEEGGTQKVGLNEALRHLITGFKTAAGAGAGITDVIPAPIAVQTQSFISGLFALDKYSSLPALTASARDDHGNGKDRDLRMAVVPRAHVVRLQCAGSDQTSVGTRLVETIVVNVDGAEKQLKIAPHCQVVLAMSCIESTRLALESFSLESSLLVTPGQELMGRNFMMHLRGDIAFKVERARLVKYVKETWPNTELADLLQLGSMHVQCDGVHGRYQYQLYAATNSNGPDAAMYRMVPDLEIQRAIADGFDDDSISFVLRASGEVIGGRAIPLRSGNVPYVDLAGPGDNDQAFNHRRAWVQFNRDHSKDPIWQDIHDTGHALARALANGGSLTYTNVGASSDFSLDALSKQQGVGTSFHDSGTLWMGENPATSVTDAAGHFHHVTNAYCADQALFPTVGSANPALTGLCLARRVAEDIVGRHGSHKASPSDLTGFSPVSLQRSEGWLTSPYDGAANYGDILEVNSNGEIGLYFLPRVLGDFDLHVEWKAFRFPQAPNSGILLRTPDPRGVNFRDKAQFDAFYESSIEIQIDDLGKNYSETRNPQAIFGDSTYKTGAIYGVAPAGRWASTVWAPDGAGNGERYWNTYLISVRGAAVSVSLNGRAVSAATLPAGKRSSGFIGFQFHTGRVQFRNLQLRL